MLAGTAAGHATSAIFPDDKTLARKKRVLKAIFTRFLAAANRQAMIKTNTNRKAPKPTKVQGAFQNTNAAILSQVASQINAAHEQAIQHADNTTEQFKDAIRSAGLTPPTEIIDDGVIHRFSTNGKLSHKSGWYMLHTDGIAAGAFGDWREGFTQNWCSKTDTSMTEPERLAHRERVKTMQREREDDLAQRQQLAATNAFTRWKAATPCAEHDYLARKGIQPHGVKIEGDKLLIPMRDTTGTLHGLQSIASDGTKMFMSGGRVKGCYFGIGKPKGALIVCEGFATGASIHECTGHAVAVAFNAGNLETVAVALRTKYPALKIVIAADDDHETPGNPGVTKAKEAVQAAGGALAIPVFKELAA